jgi:hypothetical protein
MTFGTLLRTTFPQNPSAPNLSLTRIGLFAIAIDAEQLLAAQFLPSSSAKPQILLLTLFLSVVVVDITWCAASWQVHRQLRLPSGYRHHLARR